MMKLFGEFMIIRIKKSDKILSETKSIANNSTNLMFALISTNVLKTFPNSFNYL